MKISYVREADGNFTKNGNPSKGRPIGVIVQLKGGRSGAAFWNYNIHKDKFDKRFLTSLAAGRAVLQETLRIPDREVELSKAPGNFVKLSDLVKSIINS